MAGLRKMLDRIEPMFSRGGRFEKLGALYEMLDTFLTRRATSRRARRTFVTPST